MHSSIFCRLIWGELVQQKLGGDAFDDSVYYLLCDESEVSPRFRGPLSQALAVAARKLR